jgi:hypothetical protein
MAFGAGSRSPLLPHPSGRTEGHGARRCQARPPEVLGSARRDRPSLQGRREQIGRVGSRLDRASAIVGTSGEGVIAPEAA